jgi:hypothetical protein
MSSVVVKIDDEIQSVHFADERSLSRELTLSQWMGEEFNS